MIIRDARPDELAFIGDLRVAAYRADGFLSETSAYAEALRLLGTDGAGEVLAAADDDDNVIVGTVMLQRWPDGGQVVRGPGEGEIRALAVTPGARGQGIGRALVAAVTGRARDRGIKNLLLLTDPGMRAAHHLYAEAGFARLPERDWSPRPGLTLLAYAQTLHPA